MYGATLTNDGSIISSSWKERLIEWTHGISMMDDTPFDASIANSYAVFIAILFDFTSPKTTLLIVSQTPSMGPFPWWVSL